MTFRALPIAILLTLPLSVVGCAANTGQLDSSGVGEAVLGEAYSAQLSVVQVQGDGSLSSYDGPASFAAADGALPTGLTLSEAGLISGTPEQFGTFQQEVWVSGLRQLESFLDIVTVDVTAEGAFIGHERDQLTQITDLPGYRQSDIWLRPTGGGGPDMNTYTANVGIYLPGPNGQNDGGGIDDIRIGDLTEDEVTVTLGTWEPVDEVDPSPGYPSGHYTDGNPPTHDGGFTFTAGSDTGEMPVTFSHDTLGTDITRVMVVPPDWCTAGFQEGSDWNNGYCL